MAINLIYVGLLDINAGRITLDIPPNNPLTLESLLLYHIPAQNSPTFAQTLLDGNRLRSGYAILVNGRNAEQLQGLATIVEDGATVVITAQVVGG